MLFFGLFYQSTFSEDMMHGEGQTSQRTRNNFSSTRRVSRVYTETAAPF